MSQPPNSAHNMYNNKGQPQGNQRPNMGAWQPTAPTSMQMAQQNKQHQQQQQYSQQQHMQQQRGGPYGVPQPAMAPYGYHPYYAQQAPPPTGPQRVGGWNPTYGGAPMYHQAPPPNMYYGQQQQTQHSQSRQPQQAMPNQQLPPQQLGHQVAKPRVKKALVITDKDGNPIDLSGVKKSGAKPPAATEKDAETKSADTAKPAADNKADAAAAPAPAATKDAGMDAGAKMRQLAMERIQGKAEKKEEKPTEEEAKPKEAEPKKEAAAEPKKEATPEPKKEAAPEPKKEEKPAEPPKKKGGSSLASMLAKQEQEQETKKEEETKEAEQGEANVKVNADGKKRHVYSKEEMIRLKSLPVCLVRPDDLPELEITKGPSRSEGGRGGGGGGRNRGGGGDGNSWQRGAAPPPRRQSTETNRDNAGGGQWARGQAPPPRQNNRKGKGGRGGQNDFFDGPVAPLKKSNNGWKPIKDSSPLIVAEKKVKSILNKMTKEKFDRLSTQMLEIPILSHEILTMMIHNVYEKAIDEPAFGDMYGDLCARMSQLKNTSYIQIIESDEEPPTEDGEAGQGESSAHSVFRWSNDVNANDSEIVGPFSSMDECFEVALSDEEQERKERGEMELVLHKLQIKKGMFIKIMKQKVPEREEENEEKEENEFYTVYFPVADAEEIGQQMSKIFLSEPECVSDSTKQNSFKRSLLNKCEDEFNKQDIYADWKKEKQTYEESKQTMKESERAEKEEDLEFRRIKIKKQMLGNIKFIGQLYKKSLLKEKIMRFCIASLLKLENIDDNSKLPVYKDSGDSDIDEEDHEAICNMFSTIGSTIDKPHAADFMKVCFDKIVKLSKDKKLPSRSRFMYKDLIDLKANRWVPRRKVEKAKTLEEIRKDVEREEKLQAQQSAQNNYRGGGRNSNYGNKNDNRGSRNSYSQNINRSRQQKPASQTDDDGFTTIVSGGGKSRTSFGSQSSQRSSPQKSSSKDTSRKSAYSALAEEPTPTKKAPAAEPLDQEKLERRVKSIRGEYIQDPSNITELLLSMDELTGTPDYGVKFVQLNSDRIIDCKDDERTAIYDMLSTLVEKKKLSSSDVKDGLVDLIEFIDSYVYDAPKAFDYLGDMLTAMYNVKAIDVAWICEQAKKTELADKSNPEKIIRALAGAIEAKNGKDGVKAALSDPSVSNLLGDRWEGVRSAIM